MENNFATPLLNMPTEELSENAESNDPASNVIRLLIVEDYHLTRLGLMAVLSKFPQVKFIGEAESAEEALIKMETLTPDIILLDLGLPGMNGIEMAQEVRRRWPEVKVVILTSHNEEQEVIAALGAGAQAYVLKDIKPERLVHALEAVYEGAVWLDPAIASLVLTLMNEPASPSITKKAVGTTSSATSTSSSQDSILTEREMEVLQLIVQGKSNPDIADQLCISIHTAKAHVGSILNKLCVNDRVQAAIKALKENIV